MKISQFLNQKTGLFILASVIITWMASCGESDKHVPPDVEFKTGTGYTSSDATVGQGDTVLVGIIATKTEDEMKTFNISYAYDGSTTTTTAFNEPLEGAEEENFSADFNIVTRNQAGTEKWSFTITDRDGNISTISITLTVQ